MISRENKIIDMTGLNRFRIGDEVIAEACDDHDRFEGVVIGIELQRVYASRVLQPSITLLHDGDQITDGFSPDDLRKVSAALSAGQAQPSVKAEEIDDLIDRLLDAQQDINFAANCKMDQSLCDASALIDDVERFMLRIRSALVPPAVPGEVEKLTYDEVEQIIEKTEPAQLSDRGDRIWTRRMAVALADLFNSRLYVPLQEIEGGDKGDGAETITESAGRRRTELAIAEYLKVRDESMGTPDADNAERLQSAKDIHSLVIRQQGTRTRLSERNAAALAAPSASIEGETK